MMKKRYEALKKIKKYWDNRKLSLIDPEYNNFGLCSLMAKLSCPIALFMGDINKACRDKPYYSSRMEYPLNVPDGAISAYHSYRDSKRRGITFDRRTIYGKARYQLLCDLITYYEKELANGENKK